MFSNSNPTRLIAKKKTALKRGKGGRDAAI
jgi:hypothetical protein